MAQETEIERLIVRLMGDGSSYEKMLKDAEKATDALEKEVNDLGKTESKTNMILSATSDIALGVANAIDVIGQSMINTGNYIIDYAKNAVREFAKVGDTLDKMSGRTGVSASSLSELGFAAEQSGQSLGSIEMTIRGMQRHLGKAGGLTKAFKDSLRELGIDAKYLKSLSPEDQFTLIGDAIGRIEDHKQHGKSFFIRSNSTRTGCLQ